MISRHFGILLILSLTGITLYNTMAYVGLHHTQAINGLLMLSGGPLIVAFLSLVMFGDRLTPAQAVGILISLVGVIIIIARGQLETLTSLLLNPGDLWFLAGIWVYAVYTVLLRKRPAMHTISFLGFLIIAGAVMHVPLFVIEFAQGGRMQATPAALAVIAYIVVIPSVVAYLFFNRGVELIGANRAGQFFHLIPVFGSALAIIFLGEQPKWYHGAGYALIICGIWVAQRPRPSVDANRGLRSDGDR
jgi:drug/metabolite transporter (DMT)-like permease